MRLVCHLNAADISALQSGKLMMLSLVGMDGLTLHFDPDPGEGAERVQQEDRSVSTVKIEEPIIADGALDKAESVKTDNAYNCSHCTKSFPTRKGLARHLSWVDRLSRQN